MGRKLPHIYDLIYFDREGFEIEKGPRQYSPLRGDVEREVEFMEEFYKFQQNHPQATTYKVRSMRPQEVATILKAERQEARREMWESYWGNVFTQLADRMTIDQHSVVQAHMHLRQNAT